MSDGNAEQVRLVAEQVADTAISRFSALHPEIGRAKADLIPAPLKWAAGIIAALFTTGIAGVAFWLVSSVSSMQVTLARMDERQLLQTSNQDAWKADVERRLARLESFHQRTAP